MGLDYLFERGFGGMLQYRYGQEPLKGPLKEQLKEPTVEPKPITQKSRKTNPLTLHFKES